MSKPDFSVCDRVRILQIPPQVLEKMPQESIEIFKRCAGQILRIDDLNDIGWLELNVMDDGSQAPNYCYHTIWIEPEYVERVEAWF
ncbi:MAG: hypothetical protein HC895_00425 [Leptolyngbyaceae cyanobacterium SM1_3_5]|nr:hypothetical protein [Leptolyngbyaceae cyanobacterium SM1_3_5]